ncbi:MAG: polysaccharide biosynthesis C-terminal domain-containing protein [Bacteroidetes bacterium]|nr:polysaccharide biosynthesis C-terminal domain-containing protein [Bacteroidota bacterium]
MNPLKKLASQTAIYGVSSIIGRFLNYLLVPLYTRVFLPAEYGVISEFYSYTGFLWVFLTFGMETGYFRFSKSDEGQRTYSTALIFLSVMSFCFATLVFLFAPLMGQALHYQEHLEYFKWFGLILAIDTIGAMPFARLRQEGRPVQFAAIKLIEIGVNIGFNIFFIVLCKSAYDKDPTSLWARFYSPAIGVGYVFISNLLASAVKLVLLLPQLQSIKDGFDRPLFRRMLSYSMPMVVIGLAGVTNEMLDRAILPHYIVGSDTFKREQTGIYGACYKISILMSLFIQAFRFAAEPFFFANADKENSRRTISDVMTWFVIFCCFIFLMVTLNLDFFGHFIGEKYRVGLPVVPILMLANLFLGVYVNLSVWYKLTDHTMTGAWVALGGAAVTISLNLLLIPTMGYMGSAWATLVCYFLMALVSFVMGQHYYPVPYETLKVVLYITLAVVLYAVYTFAVVDSSALVHYATSLGFMLLFGVFVIIVDGKSLRMILKLK